MTHITAVNQSSLLTAVDFSRIVLALDYQVKHHFGPYWGTHATVNTSVGGWQLIFKDDSDVQGALGYHDEVRGRPVLFVFVRTCREDGVAESSCASHEVLEALADSTVSLGAFDARSRWYALEVGDPVQRDSYTVITQPGAPPVEVSNFATKAWFDPQAANVHFDYLHKLTAPFQVGPGGYAQFMDLKDPSAGWQQIGADTFAGAPAPRRRKGGEPL